MSGLLLPKPEKRQPKQRKRIRTRRPAGTVRREAKAAGYVDPLTLAAIYSFYAGRCGYCEQAPGQQWDHMIPLSKGGTDSADNLVLSCRRCNYRKGQRTWEPKRRHPFMGGA